MAKTGTQQYDKKKKLNDDKKASAAFHKREIDEGDILQRHIMIKHVDQTKNLLQLTKNDKEK